LCVIKKLRTRGGYSPPRGLQNTNPQWVVAPVEKKLLHSDRDRWRALVSTVMNLRVAQNTANFLAS